MTAPITRTELVSPRLDAPADAPQLARSVASRSITLGVLSNGKPAAGPILDQVIARLAAAATFVDVVHLTKRDPSVRATPEELAALADRADVVVASVGDCGSCSSSLVSDVIELEVAGVPTGVLLTTPFVPVATALASLRNLPTLRVVVLPHPVDDLDAAGIAVFAPSAGDQLAALLFEPADAPVPRPTAA